MMNLYDYSTVVKEIIRGKPTKTALGFVKQIPLGISKKTFGFMLSGKTVKINSPLPCLTAVFISANRILPQQDYTLSLRVAAEGKTKTVSRRFAAEIPIEDAKKEIGFGQSFERTFYEILTTDDFEITNSEYEGTILKANDEDTARRCFQAMMGLFPFVESERETKQVKIECEFDIKKDELYGKDEKKRGTLKCMISLDGEGTGTKSNTFVF
jgi:hypothetical protein